MVCEWYDDRVCPQKKCDGNGSIYCKIKEKGFRKDEGEYRRVRSRTMYISKIHCFSLLEKSLMPVQQRIECAGDRI